VSSAKAEIAKKPLAAATKSFLNMTITPEVIDHEMFRHGFGVASDLPRPTMSSS
jgi:hypothetical protein